MKTIIATWIIKQGFPTALTFVFGLYFAWKTHQLEARLDACKDAKIEQVVTSSQSVINAVETLIGKMQEQERQFLNMQTRIKK